jgi:hypothetical protein
MSEFRPIALPGGACAYITPEDDFSTDIETFALTT